MWLSRRLYPELSYFESSEQRDAAKDQALRTIFKAWRFWLALVMLVLASQLLEEVFLSVVQFLVGIIDPAFRITIILTLAIWLGFTVVPLLLFFQIGWRPLYRRALRVELRKAGVPICHKCGYDLRASKERCSECGQEFETT